MRFAHDVRVQECIVAFLNDDRVPLWGCVGCVGYVGPNIANLRFFTPNPFSRNGNWTFINVHF